MNDGSSIQQESGLEPSAAARRLARRIDEWDRNRLHMSPGVVAMSLENWAESTPHSPSDVNEANERCG